MNLFNVILIDISSNSKTDTLARNVTASRSNQIVDSYKESTLIDLTKKRIDVVKSDVPPIRLINVLHPDK